MEFNKIYIIIILTFFQMTLSTLSTIIPINERNKYVQLYHTERFKIDYESVLETTEIKFSCENSFRDCANNGLCNETKDNCICNSGYFSFNNSFIRCTYAQKSRIVVFLLELFVPFGFGHLYLANYGFFLAKFLIYFFTYYYVFCVMIFIGSINNSNVDVETYKYTKRICCVMLPIILIWYFFDLIWILMNNYKDGNGIPL